MLYLEYQRAVLRLKKSSSDTSRILLGHFGIWNAGLTHRPVTHSLSLRDDSRKVKVIPVVQAGIL